MKKRIALAGNPNSGKTTIFNAITGSRQRVGNYPGVTVERKEGTRLHNGHRLQVSDLPGTYSLTPYTIDERVARDHLIDSPPDVIVDIIDSTNLERNLYLAIQLLELDAPVVLAFNMSDLASERGIEVDIEKLSERLGAPVIRTVGNTGEGIETLLDTLITTNDATKNGDRFTLDYGPDVEPEIKTLERVLEEPFSQVTARRRRWMAVKLLENGHNLLKNESLPNVEAAIEAATERLRARTQDSPEATIASRRYEFIAALCRDAVHGNTETTDRRTARIDSVLTHRLFGLPIFLGLMYLVFQLTFTLAGPMADGIESGRLWLGHALVAAWPSGTDSLLLSLLVDGIIGGVGGVLVFLPNIILLFLAIAVLEDSGYMARAAFLMDRLMNLAGLHGKSFIPMLIGFGCNVPAIMATRTLESRRDRMTTMLVIPLMSCSARLTIYALIIPAFFVTTWQGPVLWLMYVLGIVLAIAAANIFRSTVFKGDAAPFLMEMPPYHVPTPRSIFTHMWERASLYLRKAGTIILGISIILWALTTFPRKPAENVDRAATAITGELVAAEDDASEAEQLAYSIAGRLGHAMEPLLRPMGFDWKIGTALVGAFAAKEVFVAQMGIVYSVGESEGTTEALRAKLRSQYSPLVGFCILLFTMIAAPCMATLAIMKRESNSWGWALAQFGGLTVLAWVLTVITYQTGQFLGIGV